MEIENKKKGERFLCLCFTGMRAIGGGRSLLSMSDNIPPSEVLICFSELMIVNKKKTNG